MSTTLVRLQIKIQSPEHEAGMLPTLQVSSTSRLRCFPVSLFENWSNAFLKWKAL
jgi:hypothetical protein